MRAVSQRITDFITYVPPQDSRNVLRIVGFVEYSVAIDFLDQFRSIATREEQDIAEEIVTGRDEYSIYTNLSRQWQGAGSFLSDAPPAGAMQDQYRRRGLKWVTALARVEVGAMLAGFTSVADPFAVKPPTRYDLDAFRELLVDGYRSMYWSIEADQQLVNYSQVGIPKDQLIVQGRRLGIAQVFGSAVNVLQGTTMTRVQVAELATWTQRLKRLQIVVLYCLSKQVKVTEHVFNNGQIRSCPPLVEAIRRELPDAIGAKATTNFAPNLLRTQLELNYPELTLSCRCE